MQLVKVLQTTMLPGMSGPGYGGITAKSETDPFCAKLVTAEIRSVDGSPLFSSVFLNGTPAKRNEWDRAPRNTEYTSKEAALAGHKELLERIGYRP